MESFLEHLNVTVRDPKVTAELLCDLFGWKVRWSGDAKLGGLTYHVGGKDSYVAIYSRGGTSGTGDTYNAVGGLNHIGIVVDDLAAVEAKVKAAGFETFAHADYEPGRRFYFEDGDGIEYEVVAYP